MLELEPETGEDPVRYFCTPENAELIGWGSSGTHFVLLPGDEAVYCVEPELAGEGIFVLPVGADFREFLSHLLFCRGTSPLAQIFMLDEARFRKLLKDNAANTWPGCEEDFKRQRRIPGPAGGDVRCPAERPLCPGKGPPGDL